MKKAALCFLGAIFPGSAIYVFEETKGLELSFVNQDGSGPFDGWRDNPVLFQRIDKCQRLLVADMQPCFQLAS